MFLTEPWVLSLIKDTQTSVDTDGIGKAEGFSTWLRYIYIYIHCKKWCVSLTHM